MQQINKPYEGQFITIEGGDGSGKTTLSKSLEQALIQQGYKVFRTREPGGTPLSEHLRHLLLSPTHEFQIGEKAELLMFLAARAQHIEETILPELRHGKVVICERFNDSTIAYQGCARHLGMHFVEKLCDLVCDMEPNCTLFLDINPSDGIQRIQSQGNKKIDRLEAEELQFHNEVRHAFLNLADQHPNRIAIIDASLPEEEVLAAALKEVKARCTLKPALRK